jgi:hypothetical protein
MNANELADELLKNGGNCSWFKEIATMLRQQQADLEHMWMANTVLEAEIEALKVKAHEWYLIAMGKASEK